MDRRLAGRPVSDGFCEYVLWGLYGAPTAEYCPEPVAPDSDMCERHSNQIGMDG